MFNVGGNGTMVWFHALRDGMWYYVEAGVYDSKSRRERAAGDFHGASSA